MTRRAKTLNVTIPKAHSKGKATEAYRFFPSVRLLNCALVFLGTVCSSTNFSAFNFTLVCFVNTTLLAKPRESNDTVANENCPLLNTTIHDYGGDVAWVRSQQANVLAAFAWSGTVFTLPCGMLIHKYGVRRIFMTAQLISGVANAIVPTAIYLGEWYAFAFRFLAGSISGMGWPCIMYVVTRWGPERDAGFMKALCSGGFAFGVVVAYILSGLACSSGPYGWQYAIYYSAGLNGVFIVLFFFLFTNSPEESKLISKNELAYILEVRTFSGNAASRPQFRNVPWKGLLTSTAMWATISSNLCLGWTYMFVANFVPTYMKEVLFYDTSGNGILSALPNVAQFTGRMLFGTTSDSLTKKLDKTTSVKLFDGASLGIPAIMFVIMSFLDCRSAEVAVFCFTFGHFFLAANVAGYLRSMYYIAPKYVSIVTSFGGMAVNVPVILVPYIIGAIISNGTLDQWRSAFYLCAAINVCGMVIFTIFGSGRLQDWARDPTSAPGSARGAQGGTEPEQTVTSGVSVIAPAIQAMPTAPVEETDETSAGEHAPQYIRMDSLGNYA